MSPTLPVPDWNGTSTILRHLKDNNGSATSWSSLVGIVTAIVGNILISFALNIQRYAHIRIDREHNDAQEEKHTAAKSSRRNYGTAAGQEEVAEERARVNALAPGPGQNTEALDREDDERRPFNRSHNSSSSHGSKKRRKPDDNDDHARKSYLKSPYWWLGIALMTVGETGNFLAYGFAPASIVSPLGVVALISNCLIAPWMLKEHFRPRDFWGVLVAIAGAVIVVLSANTSETKLGPNDLWDAIRRWEFLTYIGITCVFILVLMVLSPRYGRRTILIDLGLVGLFGGYTALSTKGVASMLSGSLWRAFGFPITYALIAVLVTSAIMQIRYINRALSHFNSTQVIPTQFVLFTLSVIIGSAVLYRDFERTNADHAVKFVAGCLLTFSGVWLITSGRKNNDDGDDASTVHDGEIQLIDEEVDETEQSQMKQEPHSTRSSVSAEQANLSQKSSLSRLQVPGSVPSIRVSRQQSWEDDAKPSTQPLYRDDDEPEPPKTPPHLVRYISEPQFTPFFTPSSVPNTSQHRQSAIRADSAPADPQTPSAQPRTLSPVRADPTLIPNIIETTPPSLLRSARSSIQRLLPGPIIPPLSGSLSALVADSLLKGEGSPEAKKARQLLRRSRSTKRRLSSGPFIDSREPHSAIDPAAMRRWHTRDDVPESAHTTDAGFFEDTAGLNAMRNRRRSRLGSISGTLGGFLRKTTSRGGKSAAVDVETGPFVPADDGVGDDHDDGEGEGSGSNTQPRHQEQSNGNEGNVSKNKRPSTGRRQYTSP